jgi:hypothetical protein
VTNAENNANIHSVLKAAFEPKFPVDSISKLVFLSSTKPPPTAKMIAFSL